MKKVETFIVLVDSHRPMNIRHRQSGGRYRVGAKSEKEAEEILREKIKFGSVRTYYKCKPDDLPVMKYKEVLKEFPKNFSVDEKVKDASERVLKDSKSGQKKKKSRKNHR